VISFHLVHLCIKRDMILTLVTWSFLNTCRVRVLCYANQTPLQTANIYRCLECRWTRTLASMMVKNAGEDGEVREDRLLVWSHKDGRNLTMCSDLLIVTRVVKHHICLSNGDTSSFLRTIIYVTHLSKCLTCTSLQLWVLCIALLLKYLNIYLFFSEYIYIYIYTYTVFLGATIVGCF